MKYDACVDKATFRHTKCKPGPAALLSGSGEKAVDSQLTDVREKKDAIDYTTVRQSVRKRLFDKYEVSPESLNLSDGYVCKLLDRLGYEY